MTAAQTAANCGILFLLTLVVLILWDIRDHAARIAGSTAAALVPREHRRGPVQVTVDDETRLTELLTSPRLDEARSICLYCGTLVEANYKGESCPKCEEWLPRV